jgi:exodeoxyribonuclease-3
LRLRGLVLGRLTGPVPDALKIATWNVNSIKARLPNVLEYLREASPDVALLQEIKVVDEAFPALEIEDLGYNIAVHGQKTYNGVAILSKLPIEDVERGLPGDDSDEQARYIEATVGTLRVASIYLPNGNPTPGDKFDYKLAWMDRLRAHVEALLEAEYAFALGGDYNVCPTDDDVYDPAGFADDALCRPESRARFRALLNLGLTEAYIALHPGAVGRYSFWDYQGGAWPKDHGVRIDHFLLSPQAADLLRGCDIDRAVRGRKKASDHVPVWCEIEAA